MKNLREILESKTREELAYLIGLAYYQKDKRLGYWGADKRDIERIARIAFKGSFGRPGRTKEQMIERVLEHIGAENLRPEQI
ncbi:MAG: hypothetical protein SPI60_00130 [Campylobacter lanienae]|nr:hypothetical protein [Campylobacter lanienae]